jgi:hypothetical protein
MNNINFEKHFVNVASQNKDSYLHSFLYYTITGRKSAWMYKGHGSFLVVCQHPHNPRMLLVFPEVGDQSFELTASVLQKLYRSDHQIRLARYKQEDYTSLKASLAKRDFNIVDRLRIVEEKDMDWKYPTYILDVDKVSDMYGKDFEDVRAKFNKAHKLGVEYRPINKKTVISDMRAALKYWEGSMIAEGKDTDDMTEFYERFFDLLKIYNGQYDGLLYFIGRRPVGFTVWDQVNDDFANGLINLADISITGLSDFQIVTLCRLLKEKGVKYLNVGGSETESLDLYKRKFHPVESIPMMSIDVDYKDFKNDGVQVSKFV